MTVRGWVAKTLTSVPKNEEYSPKFLPAQRNVITVTNFWGRAPYESFQWVPPGHSSGLGAINVPYKTHHGKETACIIKVKVIRRKRFKGEATYWKINNLADQNWEKMFALLADTAGFSACFDGGGSSPLWTFTYSELARSSPGAHKALTKTS